MIRELSVEELDQKFKDRASFVLVDVREADEYAVSRIEGCVFIPMSQFEKEVDRLDPKKQYVVYCRRGGRSAQVCAYMQTKGFQDVLNLKGGIIDWAAKIEPDMPVG